jgi:hypothetical protein
MTSSSAAASPRQAQSRCSASPASLAVVAAESQFTRSTCAQARTGPPRLACRRLAPGGGAPAFHCSVRASSKSSARATRAHAAEQQKSTRACTHDLRPPRTPRVVRRANRCMMIEFHSVPLAARSLFVSLRPSRILVDVLRAAARFVPTQVMAQRMCAVRC